MAAAVVTAAGRAAATAVTAAGREVAALAGNTLLYPS
jgi:hypothetical protein